MTSNRSYASPTAYRITWHFGATTHIGYWCGSCYATRTMPGPTSLPELHEGPFEPPGLALCAGCQKPWDKGKHANS
jgi:hypothetical protein